MLIKTNTSFLIYYIIAKVLTEGVHSEKGIIV